MNEQPKSSISIEGIEGYIEYYNNRVRPFYRPSNVSLKLDTKMYKLLVQAFTASECPQFLPLAYALDYVPEDWVTPDLERAYYGEPLTSKDVVVERRNSPRGLSFLALRSLEEDSLQLMRRVMAIQSGQARIVDIYSEPLNPAYVPLPDHLKDLYKNKPDIPSGMEPNLSPLELLSYQQIIKYAASQKANILGGIVLEELNDFFNKRVPKIPSLKLT